jgi:hypothetical protein
MQWKIEGCQTTRAVMDLIGRVLFTVTELRDGNVAAKS